MHWLRLSLPDQKATRGGVLPSGESPELLFTSRTEPPDWTPVPNRLSSQKAGWSSVQWTQVGAHGVDPALVPALGE